MFKKSNLSTPLSLVLFFIFLFMIACPSGAFAQKMAINDLPTKTVGKKQYYYYVVQPGETIHQLSERWHITRNDIVYYNKKANDGIKPGSILYFPVDVFENYIPKPLDAMAQAATNDTVYEATPILISSVRLKPVEPEIEYRPATLPADTELKVAVCLPFDLGNINKTGKQSIYATDFYKGFLMAIDSLRAEYGNPNIKIFAIDTENPNRVVLSKDNADQLREADIIIAPDQAAQLIQLANYGKENAKYVFNVFQPRDSTYLDNPYVLQGTTPADVMYKKAHFGLLTHLDGAVPVILDNTQSKKDKQNFVTELIKEFTLNDINFINIPYAGTLTDELLAANLPSDAKNFLFIPTSSALVDFQKFEPVLTRLKQKISGDDKTATNVRLFGYPEYTRFHDADFLKLRDLNTILYSRFFNDPKALLTRKLQNSFLKRFGTGLPEGVPNQALYGFDVARWLLELATSGAITSDTITGTWADKNSQMAYRFQSVPAGGFVNNAILIVTLSPYNDAVIEIL